MSKWAKVWWVLVALWELVILAGIAGASILGLYGLLIIATTCVAVGHMVSAASS